MVWKLLMVMKDWWLWRIDGYVMGMNRIEQQWVWIGLNNNGYELGISFSLVGWEMRMSIDCDLMKMVWEGCGTITTNFLLVKRNMEKWEDSFPAKIRKEVKEVYHIVSSKVMMFTKIIKQVSVMVSVVVEFCGGRVLWW